MLVFINGSVAWTKTLVELNKKGRLETRRISGKFADASRKVLASPTTIQRWAYLSTPRPASEEVKSHLLT